MFDPSVHTSCPSLVDVLRQRAAEQPSARCYTFLRDGEVEEGHADHAQLDLHARAIGASLQAAGATGQPVLLLFPPGLHYVTAVLGCLYAGAIAVPAYPPDPSRLARTLPRLASLIADARARFALTTAMIRDLIAALPPDLARFEGLTWLAVDETDPVLADAWRHPRSSHHTLALLQYTSGSTGTPRGVMLSHGNLLHNSAAIYRYFGHSAASQGVIWLPPYHDMGLIGGILQPLWGGFPVVLMSPLDFLRKPLRWLQAISRYRATTSGGPNFAFDLCVRKTTAQERAALDLRCWDLAFNGAEPIQAETLNRFAEAFAPAGFRPESFYPCYGLAEGTLIVTGAVKQRPTVVGWFDGRGLEAGQTRPVPAPATAVPPPSGARALIGCGRPHPDQALHIVDPATGVPLSEGQIGEIWVRGPSIAQGYWQRPEETRECFAATLVHTGHDRHLRTGDLGFLWQETLFITGRIKDLIIIRGRNHYPHDIERTAEHVHPALRPGCSAAFSIDKQGHEHLVLVQELDPKTPVDAALLGDAIATAIAQAHEIPVHAVVLLGAGGIPKTSSGKIQRRACRSQFLDGTLAPVLARCSAMSATPAALPSDADDRHDSALAAAPPLVPLRLSDLPTRAERLREAAPRVKSLASRVLDVPLALLDCERPLVAFGLDSIRAVELDSALQDNLGISVAMERLLGGATVADLVEQVASEPAPRTADLHITSTSSTSGDPAQTATAPLAHAQERLLFLETLTPGSAAYHIAAAVWLQGTLDPTALTESLRALVQRHDILRARFPRRPGQPIQVFAPPETQVPLARLTLPESVPPDDRHAAALALAHEHARQPFDLAIDLPIRAQLIAASPNEHLLAITVHHLVADGWSMGVLVRELGLLYGASITGTPAALPSRALHYADFARWQQRWLHSHESQTARDYWCNQLRGAPPLLELPTDRQRPETPTFAGRRHWFVIPADLANALTRLARDHQATPYMVLLAGFLALLQQRTGVSDLVVGTDVANRDQTETQGLVGLMVNQLVLRVPVAPARSLRSLIAETRRVALAAYAHRHLPFGLLVELLRPPRDPRWNPLFQIMFVLENAPLPPLALPGLRSTVSELDDGGSPFDLSLLLTAQDNGFTGALRYKTALFDAERIADLADDYLAVLQTLASEPDTEVAALDPLLGARQSERQHARQQALRAARQAKFDALKNKKNP